MFIDAKSVLSVFLFRKNSVMRVTGQREPRHACALEI